MKTASLFLTLPSIFSVVGALATEGLLPSPEHAFSRPNAYKQSPHSLRKSDTAIIENPSLSSHHDYPLKQAPSLSKEEPGNEIVQIVKRYQEEGMSFSDALIKATRDLQQRKETHLEKELRQLGCVEWSEIKNITPSILQVVKAMYHAEKGPFILRPGLTIIYINEK